MQQNVSANFLKGKKMGSNEAFPNPIVLQRADPWVLKDGKSYFFTGSYPDYDRIVLRKAHNLESLQKAEEKTIWTKHDSGPLSNLIWAPEIHKINGNWYIYFAASPDDTPKSDISGADPTFNHRIYVLECTDDDPIEGTWYEKGQVDTGWESFALDATSFMKGDIQYLVWAQQDFEISGNSNLYIAEMENPWSLKSDAILLSAPEEPWECVGFSVNEGPAVLFTQSKIHITYSGAATGPEYAMGILTADLDSDLLEQSNWKKSKEPIFQSNPENKIFGPGHNSFTEDIAGNPVMIYHARTYTEISGDPLWDPNRQAFAKTIEINGDEITWGSPLSITRDVPTTTKVLPPEGI